MKLVNLVLILYKFWSNNTAIQMLIQECWYKDFRDSC